MLTRRWMFVCVVLLAAASGPARSAQPARLFTSPTTARRDRTEAVQPRGVRSRIVGVASERLADSRLVLDLFDGQVLVAEQLPGSDVNGDDFSIWSGAVEGEPLSAVTFVRGGGVVQGSIQSSAGSFSLEPVGEGPDYRLEQVDPAAAAPELVPLAPPLARDPGARLAETADSDDVPIDVLVVYTAAARRQAGGTDAAVRARVALGVAETNLAFANSGVSRRLRLVGTDLVGYSESGNLATDLGNLTSASDGLMDDVHARRDATGADLVQLVVGATGGGACGVAWLMNPVTIGFAPYAFSVSAYPCISPNYTFGHELAHNMGAAHAPEDPNSTPPLPYAYGYKDQDGLFRTVMAYDCPAGCPRVLHFSNPDQTYSGQPTGTAELHNNAHALTLTTPTVTGFRPFRPAESLLSAPLSLELETDGTTVRLSWSAPEVGTPNRYVVEVGTDEGLTNVARFIVDASSTTFERTQVPPGTYFVRVRGLDDTGPGGASISVSLRMTDIGKCIVRVGAPTLTTATVSGSVVSLAWTSPSVGRPVDRYVVGVGTRPEAVDVGIIDTESAARSYSSNADPGVYFLRVAGINGCGIGVPSNEVSVVVGPPIPGPPSDLLAGISEEREVSLYWHPSSAGGAATAYVVEAGDAPGLSNVAVLPTDSWMPSFTIGAPPGRYFVRVRAVNALGTSVPSEEIVVLVL